MARIAQVGLKALEVGEHEQRIEKLEAALGSRRETPPSPFDADPEGPDLEFVESRQ